MFTLSKKDDKPFQKSKLEPKTQGQADYIRTVAENYVTIVVGPAGCGKSSIAVGLAASWLAQQKVERIILCRPILESGPSIGFLPGDASEKSRPYTKHLYEELNKYYSYADIAALKNSNLLEFIPTVFLQGRTFDRSFMILDEGSNATEEELMLFLTRLGKNSYAIVNGDPAQSYLHPDSQGALLKAYTRFQNIKGIGTVRLTEADICRHRLVGPMVAAMRG